MYGLVNKAIKGFAIESGGEAAWDAISEKTKITEDFLAMHAYDDSVTYALVEAASEHFSIPADDVLFGFGRHWILFTAEEGYAELLDMYGQNMEEFIMNLDDMHSRIQLSMPQLKMPNFSCERTENGELIVDYRSERPGLSAMVHGLLAGLGERFKQNIEITSVESPADITARFMVKFLAAERDAA